MSGWRAAPSLSARESQHLAEVVAREARGYYSLTGPVKDDWCGRLGVTLASQAQPQLGRYTRLQSGPRITLCPDGASTRRNFTLAHELGHHFLEEGRRHVGFRRRLGVVGTRLLGRLATASADEEMVADRLAGALLLDYDAVRGLADDPDQHVRDLLLLARRHAMSPVAVAYRLRQATDWAATYVVVDRGRSLTVVESHGRVWHFAAGARLTIETAGPVDATHVGRVEWAAGVRRVTLTACPIGPSRLAVLVTDAHDVPGRSGRHRWGPSAPVPGDPTPGRTGDDRSAATR